MVLSRCCGRPLASIEPQVRQLIPSRCAAPDDAGQAESVVLSSKLKPDVLATDLGNFLRANHTRLARKKSRLTSSDESRPAFILFTLG